MSFTDNTIALQKSRFNMIEKAADFSETDFFPINRQLINIRLEMLEQHWTRFREEHENLCHSRDDTLSEHEYIRNRVFERCEAFYVYSRAKLITHRDELDSTDRQSGTTASDPGPSTSMTPRSMLPRITIPTFSGDYKSWRSYRDLFTSIIRNNTALSHVEKMHYLKTSLSGDASRMIANLDVSHDNFQEAWNVLLARYENKRLLITSHAEKLFDLKPLKTESAKGLSTILTTVSESIGALRALGCNVQQWDPLLIPYLKRLLDSETHKAWEMKLGSSSVFPTLAQLKEFLLARIRGMENLSQPTASLTVSKENTRGYPGRHRSKVAAHTTKSAADQGPPKCPLCDSPHFVSKCDRYLSKTTQQRRDLILKHRLCFNCLGSHLVSKCPSPRRCQKCGKKHHTSIHVASAGIPKTTSAGASNQNEKTQLNEESNSQ